MKNENENLRDQFAVQVMEILLNDFLIKMRKNDFYVEKTGGDREAIDQMMKAETWIKAEKAKRLGYIIGEPDYRRGKHISEIIPMTKKEVRDLKRFAELSYDIADAMIKKCKNKRDIKQ